MSIDPVIHAALVTVFAWGIKLGFTAIGFDVGADVYTALAGFSVAYILSLFGYSFWVKLTANRPGARTETRYRPPFS